jgi:hypothetical protein
MRHLPRSAVRGALIVLAAGLVVTACSDDDDDDTEATLATSSPSTGSATDSSTDASASTSGGDTTASASTTSTAGGDTTSTAASSSSGPPDTTPTTITGSGNVVSRDYPLADFTRVDVSSAFTVEVGGADVFQVTVEADDNVFDRLVVEVVDGELRIGVANNTTLQDVQLSASVLLPVLEGLEVSGAVDATVTPNSTASLEVEATGASTVTISGEAEELTIDLSGASTFDGRNLTAVVLSEAELSGASDAEVTVTGRLDSVEASGGSELVYFGDPEVGEVETSGGSSVEPG